MIRILLADTSAVYRSIEKQLLKCNSRFELCGECSTEKELGTLAKELVPDAVIADYGIFGGKNFESTLYTLALFHCPVIYFAPSDLIHAGVPRGVKLISKPRLNTFSQSNLIEYSSKLEDDIIELRLKLKERKVRVSVPEEPLKNINTNFMERNYRAVCVGVSTGGPGTVLEFLKNIGPHFPLPIFITQHIDSTFDKNLIDWLSNNAPMPIKLAEHNMLPKPGFVYFAPADNHLVFGKNENGVVVLKLNKNPPRNFLRPSVDEMFESAALTFGENCISVLLTGMGADGAEGSCRIRARGGYTIAQDEASCVVYGMPKAAVDAGGIVEILALSNIPKRVRKLVEKQ